MQDKGHQESSEAMSFAGEKYVRVAFSSTESIFSLVKRRKKNIGRLYALCGAYGMRLRNWSTLQEERTPVHPSGVVHPSLCLQ